MIENPELMRGLFELGGTVVVSVVFGVLAYRFFSRVSAPFLESMNKISTAMSAQAGAITDVKDTVVRYTAQDSREHTEILLAVQVMGKEMLGMREAVEALDKRLAGAACEEKPVTLRNVAGDKQ